MRAIKYLNHSELESITTLLKRHNTSRDGLLIELALSTGARCCELRQLQKRDLDFYDRTIRIKAAKGSNDRVLPLAADLFTRLAKYTEDLSPTGKLFPISYQRVQQIWNDWRPKSAADQGKGFHSLRHTYAIGRYRQTKDILLVKRALGHKSLNSTMIYTDYLHTTEELRASLEVAV